MTLSVMILATILNAAPRSKFAPISAASIVSTSNVVAFVIPTRDLFKVVVKEVIVGPTNMEGKVFRLREDLPDPPESPGQGLSNRIYEPCVVFLKQLPIHDTAGIVFDRAYYKIPIQHKRASYTEGLLSREPVPVLMFNGFIYFAVHPRPVHGTYMTYAEIRARIRKLSVHK